MPRLRVLLPLTLAGMLACDPTPVATATPAPSAASPTAAPAAAVDWTRDTAVDVTPMDFEILAADGSSLGSFKALRAARGDSPDFPGTFLSLDDWSAVAATQSIVLSWDAASSRLTIGERVIPLLQVNPSKPEKPGVPAYGLVHNGMLYFELAPPAQHAMFPATSGSRQEKSASGIVLRLQ